MKKLFFEVWLWVGRLVGVSTPQDFINLTINRIFTADVRVELTHLIIAAAQQNLSGEQKKQLVIEHIMNSRDQITANIKQIGLEALSMGINQIVEELQAQGVIPHTGINKGVN